MQEWDALRSREGDRKWSKNCGFGSGSPRPHFGASAPTRPRLPHLLAACLLSGTWPVGSHPGGGHDSEGFSTSLNFPWPWAGLSWCFWLPPSQPPASSAPAQSGRDVVPALIPKGYAFHRASRRQQCLTPRMGQAPWTGEGEALRRGVLQLDLSCISPGEKVILLLRRAVLTQLSARQAGLGS